MNNNFICAGCGGELLHTDTQDSGRKVYSCNRCQNSKMLECVICDNPRSVWGDDGTICGVCTFEMLNGKRIFTPEQKEKIQKWTVEVTLDPPNSTFSKN